MWADFKASLGRRVHQQSGPGWSFLAVEERNPAGKVLYAPYGPVATSPEAFDDALAALAKAARSCGAVFVRIEPVSAGLELPSAAAELRGRGLQPAPVNQQPELDRPFVSKACGRAAVRESQALSRPGCGSGDSLKRHPLC